MSLLPRQEKKKNGTAFFACTEGPFAQLLGEGKKKRGRLASLSVKKKKEERGVHLNCVMGKELSNNNH